MPQLEQTATFASQIFWLLVTFGVLYWILVRAALPRLGAILQERQERIDDDLRRAEELRVEARAVLESYEAAAAEAREQAQALIRETAHQLALDANRRHDELSARLKRDSEAAEQRIEAAKRAALANIQAVAAEVAQAAAARLIGAEVSEDEATSAVANARGDAA